MRRLAWPLPEQRQQPGRELDDGQTDDRSDVVVDRFSGRHVSGHVQVSERVHVLSADERPLRLLPIGQRECGHVTCVWSDQYSFRGIHLEFLFLTKCPGIFKVQIP